MKVLYLVVRYTPFITMMSVFLLDGRCSEIYVILRRKGTNVTAQCRDQRSKIVCRSQGLMPVRVSNPFSAISDVCSYDYI